MTKTVELTDKQIKFIMKAIWTTERELQGKPLKKGDATGNMLVRLKKALNQGKVNKCLKKEGLVNVK